jgi:hypothetical protein
MKQFNLQMVVLSVFTLLLAIGTANAETICVQGVAGQVQNPERFDSPMYFGWGLELDMSPSERGWVHYSIPVSSDATRLRRIKVDMDVRDGAVIDRIHLWTDRRVSAREVLWDTSGVHRSRYDVDVAEGLNVALRVASGWDAGGYRVRIRGVCAEFE